MSGFEPGFAASEMYATLLVLLGFKVETLMPILKSHWDGDQMKSFWVVVINEDADEEMVEPVLDGPWD